MRSSRCLKLLHALVSIRVRRGPAIAPHHGLKSIPGLQRMASSLFAAKKKTAARGLPLAATGLNCDRICSLPESL
jgi:hypothetical protein